MAKPGRPKQWTDDRIEQVAKDLEEWFLADEENVFYQAFFATRKELHPDMIARFRRVNEEFNRTVKRIETLQQMRLVHKGFKNPVMAIFCLKANHGWKDTQHVVSETHVHKHDKPELQKLDSSSLKDLLRKQTEVQKN